VTARATPQQPSRRWLRATGPHPTLVQPGHHLDQAPQRPAQPVQPPTTSMSPGRSCSSTASPAAAAGLAGPTAPTHDRSTSSSSRPRSARRPEGPGSARSLRPARSPANVSLHHRTANPRYAMITARRIRTPLALHGRVHSQARERPISSRSAAQARTAQKRAILGRHRGAGNRSSGRSGHRLRAIGAPLARRVATAALDGTGRVNLIWPHPDGLMWPHWLLG